MADKPDQGGPSKTDKLADTQKPAPEKKDAPVEATGGKQPATQSAAPTAKDEKKPAPPPPPKRPVAEKPPARQREGSRASLLVAVFALVIALGALGGGAWLYQQHTDLKARVGEVDRDAQARYEQLDGHDAIKGLDERTRLLAERVAARFAKIDESLLRTDEALRTAAEQQINDERGWRLAEVEYVLRIAAHRLMLLDDVEGAIAALQTADQQLHALSSPVFIPLRERLNADMRALRAVKQPDIPGIAIRIDGLMDVVYELPPRTAQVAFQQASTETATGLSGLWGMLEKLPITIKRNDQPLRAPPIRYAPEQHARTLAAGLSAARKAAFRTDTNEYTRLLALSADTVREHFDPESRLVTDTLGEIEKLAGVSLTAEMPDITGSFEMLDELRSRGEQAEEEQ